MSNPEPYANQEPNAVPATGRRRRGWLKYVVLGLLLAVALVVILAPSIASTSWGRGLIVGTINDAIRGSVIIDALHLSWLGGQGLRGVAVRDPNGKPVSRLEELSTELTLLQAVRGELSLGRTTIQGLTADLVVDASGQNNLSQALAPTRPAAAEAGPIVIPLTGNMELTDARITVTAPDTEPVVFEGLSGTLQVAPVGRALDVALKGRSRQGDQAGEFALSGKVEGLIAADGSLTPHTAQGGFEGSVKDLPVDGIDGMLGLQGVLSAALGKRANLEVQATGTAETQQLTATAKAPHLQAALKARVQQQRLALTEPATLRLDVQPALIRKLAQPATGEPALRLVEAFPLQLTAERLDLSLTAFNLGDVALRVGVNAPQPMKFAGAPELGEVMLRKLTALVDSEALAQRVDIALEGEAVTQNKPGQLNVQGSLTELFDRAGQLQLDKMRADVEANLTSVPTALIDQLAGQQGALVDALGPKMDLKAQLASSGPERIDGTLNLNAGPLRAPDVAFSLADAITLTKPARIDYALSPQVARRLLGKDSGLALQQPAALALNIQAFSAPRPKAGEPVFQPANTKLEGSLTSERLALSGIPDLGAIHVNDARFDLKADSLSAIRLGGTAQVSEPKQGMLAELKASPLKVNIDATTGLDKDGAFAPIDARLQLVGDGVNSDVNARIDKDFSRVNLTAPASIRLLVTPGLLKRLALTAPNQPTLAKPAPVKIDLTQLDLPLAPFAWTGVQAKAAARIDELILAGDKSVAGTALRNADLALDYQGSRAAAAVKLTAATVLPGQQQPGALRVDAALSDLLRNGEPDLTRAGVNAKAKIDGLPTALIGALSGQSGLVPLLGESVNLDATADITSGAKRAGTLDVKTQSRTLTADVGFKLGDELVSSRPARVRWTLTPTGYAALTAPAPAAKDAKPSGYALAEEATFDAVINQLRWPLPADDKAAFNASRAALDATVTAPRLALRDRASGRTVAIEGLNAALRGADLSKPIGLELSAKIRDAQGAKAQTGDAAGQVSLTGQAADVVTKDGQFNIDGASLRLTGELQKLPVALVDQMLAMDGLTLATLGNSANVTVDTNLERMAGPLNLKVRADNASADIQAQLRKEGLVLNAPLIAEVKVTQPFGKLVLGKIHPIFETTQSSERAIRFEMPREGVLIPVRDYDISKVVVPRMTLDIGTLALKSGWLLKGTIGLAQQFGRLEGAGRDQWTAQFTPAILQLRAGKVTYERRLDLLLDERLHLATWGIADLANDRAELTLAFMPETLEKVFGLAVAPGDAFRIPIRGALSGPKMDFGKAGLELGRLRAQRRLVKKDQLLGALVGSVTATAIGGGPIPPASVTPLPWGPLPVPEGQAEAQPKEETRQPAEPAPRKSVEEQAVEGLIDLFRKKK